MFCLPIVGCVSFVVGAIVVVVFVVVVVVVVVGGVDEFVVGCDVEFVVE